MSKKSNIKFSSILLWSILALSVIHFTILMLSLFGVFSIEILERSNFNYIIAFVLVAICLILYILLMFVEKRKKMIIPEWFKNVFYIGFYVFTNIYYFFGLFGTIAGLVVFYIYFAFILNIIALSVFFNTQKSDTNVLKTTTTYTSLTTLCYAVTGGALVEIIISAFKVAFAKNSTFTSLSMFIIDMCIIVLISVIMALVYAGSLSRNKVIINKCLIKYYK